MIPGTIIELKELKFCHPFLGVENMNDIYQRLKKIVDPKSKSEMKIVKKSKSSFEIRFEKGLGVYGIFLFNKKILKRLI